MIPFRLGRRELIVLLVTGVQFFCARNHAQPDGGSHFFMDCSTAESGDGSQAHPWNALPAAERHIFQPGDSIALMRGTVCNGSFTPQGSGTDGHVIRLTAYGNGARPRIVAARSAPQVLLLANQGYWQVDSLDLSGANHYGIFVNADRRPLRHIYLRNLYVHDVTGGPLKNKDNGLVVIGRSSENAVIDDVLVDGVDAAHTNQWAGILVGGGNYGNGPDPAMNQHVIIRNSTAHDVYGDGIVLFRDQESAIRTSAAWQTGMQSTETSGTPNAIWTWTCTDCTVEDNEAYLTDSPGVDGGAYDIDWHNTRNTVQRNYAHDTQGYCVAVFAAGFTTLDSVVRDNVCIANGRSPRLAALQGALYLHTWNDGPICHLTIEGNTIDWNPPVAAAAAIVNDALVRDSPIVFRHNRVLSTSPRIYNSNAHLDPSANTYILDGAPLFTLGEKHNVTLEALQAAGIENGSIAEPPPAHPKSDSSLRIESDVDFALDGEGLLASNPRAQLIVLRSLAGEYAPERLKVLVHLHSTAMGDAEANALRDLEDVYPGALSTDHIPAQPAGTTRLLTADGELLHEWHGFVNAATLGGAVRALIGAPQYAHMQSPESSEEIR
jgi:parallel beta helix pectate lyase-like protein